MSSGVETFNYVQSVVASYDGADTWSQVRALLAYLIQRLQDIKMANSLRGHPLGLYLNVFITKNMSTSLNCDKPAPPRPLAQIFNGGQRRINQPGPRRVHDDGAGDDSHLLTTYCQRSRLLIIECMKSEKRSANTLKGWLQKRNSHAPFSPLSVF